MFINSNSIMLDIRYPTAKILLVLRSHRFKNLGLIKILNLCFQVFLLR